MGLDAKALPKAKKDEAAARAAKEKADAAARKAKGLEGDERALSDKEKKELFDINRKFDTAEEALEHAKAAAAHHKEKYDSTLKEIAETKEDLAALRKKLEGSEANLKKWMAHIEKLKG